MIKRLPGLRQVLADRDRLRDELRTWKQSQSFPPGHFYSPIPHRDDVVGIGQRSGRSNRHTLGGVDLQWNQQRTLFETLAAFYADLPFGATEAQRSGHRYYFENGYFSYSDGIVLYGLLRHLRPRRLIEVGSGFSSCLMLDVNELFDLGMTCTFIEPHPERLYANLRPADCDRVEIREQRVQEVDATVFDRLQAGDVLFIDSSHVGKAGSDVNYLFFEILPRLQPGVWVHVHDVFYPFEYPEEWLVGGRSWNEAYLLRAFLMHNSEFAIRLWGDALAVRWPDFVERLMPLCLRNTGASLWIKRDGTGTSPDLRDED